MNLLSGLKTELKMMFTPGRIGRERYFFYLIIFTGFSEPLVNLFIQPLLNPNPAIELSLLFPMLAVIAVQTGVYAWFFARRINDLGYSSKWMWIVLISIISLFFVGPFIPKLSLSPQGITTLILCLSIIAIILLIKPGNASDNRFGPPPPATDTLSLLLLVLVLLVLHAVFSFKVAMQLT